MATREEERRRQGLAGTLTPPTGPNPSQRYIPPRRAQQTQPPSLGAYGAGQATRQALGTTYQSLTGTLGAVGSTVADPYVQAGRGAMNFGRGLLGMEQPTVGPAQGTDSAVGAQQGAGTTIPRVQQQPAQPPPRSFRDNPAMASTQPSMNPQQTRSLALQSAQSQSPIGMARQSIAGGPPMAQGEQRLMGQAPARTRYLGQGGTAEFQGQRQGGGGFGGAATNAQAQATLADYRSQGLNMYGNDMQAIGQLNQIGDRMQQARLANVAGNPEYRTGERDQARQTLATLQQGTQIQQQGAQTQQQAQAAAQQQAIDNRINFERLGLDQAEFNRQVEQDGKLDRVEWGAKIAETYDPFNAPKDADGNPVDRQTYVQQTLNDILAGTGVVAGPDGTIYNAAEIQALADRDFGGDVQRTRDDMRAKGFLGV